MNFSIKFDLQVPDQELANARRDGVPLPQDFHELGEYLFANPQLAKSLGATFRNFVCRVNA